MSLPSISDPHREQRLRELLAIKRDATEGNVHPAWGKGATS